MKDKAKIFDALMSNLPAAAMKKPEDMDYVKDTEEDYKYSREKLKALIDKAEKAIDTMMDLATDAEHPRAFEVLSGMLKHTSEMTMELHKIQSERKKMNDGKDEKKTEVTNNSIFLGSTSELQKFLAAEKEKIVIVDEPESLIIDAENPE